MAASTHHLLLLVASSSAYSLPAAGRAASASLPLPRRIAPRACAEPAAVPDEEHQPTRRRDDEADGRRGSAEVEVPSLSVSLEPRALHLWGNHTQSPNPGLHINHVHGQKVSG